MQLDKAGGTANGSIVVIEDDTAPFDCAEGTESTGPLTLTPLDDPLLPPHDEDGDGCSDYAELGTDGADGGLRDPFNPWDYYDVSIPRDGIIDLPNDILGVILHFAPTGAPPYEARFDRGPTIPGGAGHWTRGEPDGVIDLPNDILGVILQFHPTDCSATPS